MGIYAGMDVSDKTTHLCVTYGDTCNNPQTIAPSTQAN